MLSAVILLPEAVADIADGFGWYEDQELGLGEEFLRCLDRAYALIAAHPLHYLPAFVRDLKRLQGARESVPDICTQPLPPWPGRGMLMS